MGSEIKSQRFDRVRTELERLDQDALLVVPGPDFFYLTGVSLYAGERLLALVTPRQGVPKLLAPRMNVAQVEGVVPGAEVRGWSDEEGYREPLARLLADMGLESGAIAVDDEMRSAFLLDLQQVCPRGRTVQAGPVMRALRLRKDAAELALMDQAAGIADAAVATAHAACRTGAMESVVAAVVQQAMESASQGAKCYGCIVASGANSALPHHETGTRALERGDVVILDYGCIWHGYHSDITLTASLGPPSDEARRVREAVWTAQQRALEAIRPGVACEAVDRAARETIERAGYGEFFIHRTGHGIGLQVHEAPNLVAGNTEPLAEGMCFSVEPGIYLPGRFGVRLEVIVTVTADGCRLLNAPSQREWPVL
jgi:Xaa-Pro aminopeptidase